MVELEFKTQVPVSLQSELCTAIEYSCQGLDVKDIVSPLSALLAHKKLFWGDGIATPPVHTMVKHSCFQQSKGRAGHLSLGDTKQCADHPVNVKKRCHTCRLNCMRKYFGSVETLASSWSQLLPCPPQPT